MVMKVEVPAADTMIVLIVEYDGTRYHGSQLQANAPTIQGEIEKALFKLTGVKTRIKAASRTDAGVHATGQVVSFRTGATLPLKSFVEGTNHYLPEDIAIQEAHIADSSFDVRRNAKSREYRYSIMNSGTRSPIRRDFTWQVGGKLDIAAMQRACRALIGRHDFASFVTDTGILKKSTVRDVHKAEVEKDGDIITFKIIANSFLPHQVRNTVGSLVKVGQGKMTEDEFTGMIEAKEPGLAGPTAPAGGLCLMQINYPSSWGDAK